VQHQRLAKPEQSKLAGQSSLGRPPAMQSPSARYTLASRTGEQAPEVTQDLSVRSNTLQGDGQPLPESDRTFFEPRFAHDFSRVPAHSDARAAETDYALGHQAMQKLFPTGVLQAKLRINQPGDRYEQEADRVAEQVMRMPEPVETVPGSASPNIQRKSAACASGHGPCPECAEKEQNIRRKPLAASITPLVLRQAEGPEEEEEEEEKLLQTKSAGGEVPEVTPRLDSRINALRGGGQPLSQSARDFFEPRFGYDFSRVRVHTDSRAADTACALNARAFTLGHDITFGSGQYSPTGNGGQRLLAHELTHTLQQENTSLDLSSRSQYKTVPVFHNYSHNLSLKRNAKPHKEKVIIWINAFIPKDVPGVTKTVPSGAFKGKTMVEAPWYVPAECFLTDNRSFSSQPAAKSRMRQGLVIDLHPLQVSDHIKYSDPTTEIDCSSGKIVCLSMADSKGIRYSVKEKGSDKLLVHIEGSASNPCIRVSPNIDYEGSFLVQVGDDQRSIAFMGLVDEFPAFEMYAVSTIHKSPLTIFKSLPPKGKTPTSLFGGPKLKRKGFVVF